MSKLPPLVYFGCTIETNREDYLSNAPGRHRRFVAMANLAHYLRTFITIEPVMDFDVEAFAYLLISVRPGFVNIGADSKGHGLPEPSFAKVDGLIARLTAAGIEVREKRNLERLKK